MRGIQWGASGGLLVYTYIGPTTEALTGQGGLMLAAFIGTVGVAGVMPCDRGGTARATSDGVPRPRMEPDCGAGLLTRGSSSASRLPTGCPAVAVDGGRSPAHSGGTVPDSHRLPETVLFWTASENDPGLRAQLMRFTPSMLVATSLLLLAAGAEGITQTALWAAALLADYLGNFLGGARGWRLRSVGHFAERHALILIIALGESLLSIGFGVAGLSMSWPIVLGAVLGLGLAGTLWRAYFEVNAPTAEHAIAALPAAEQPRVARDAYSYLHLPLIAGILLTALGLKKALEHVGDPEQHIYEPLTGVPLFVLVGGVALYLLAQIAFTLRTGGRFSVKRVAAVALLFVLLAVGPLLPILVTLALLTLVTACVVEIEVRRARRDARGADTHG